jgi:uncharacterized membrane protein YgdD (TMEM256/DUF423 family)
MRRSFLIAGILLAGLAVGLGAFGAHGLKNRVDEQAVDIFKTGVQYQLYHALALILAGIVAMHLPTKLVLWAGNFFMTGILFFSGSLYTITACKAVQMAVPSFVGPITPLGGLLFILGWIFLLIAAVKKKQV